LPAGRLSESLKSRFFVIVNEPKWVIFLNLRHIRGKMKIRKKEGKLENTPFPKHVVGLI